VQWREKKTRRQKAVKSIRMKCCTKREENREEWRGRKEIKTGERYRKEDKKCRKYKAKILRKMNK